MLSSKSFLPFLGALTPDHFLRALVPVYASIHTIGKKQKLQRKRTKALS